MAAVRQVLPRERQGSEGSSGRRRRPVLRPKRRRDDPRPWLRSIILLIMLVALALLLLTRYSLETTLSFKLEEESKRLSQARTETERLQMENNRNSSIGAIEKRASELGFRDPEPEQRVYLNPATP